MFRFNRICVVAAAVALFAAGVVQAALITPTVQGFSSTVSPAARSANNTVNGSGMSGPGNLGDTHDTNGIAYWTTNGNNIGGAGASPANFVDNNPFITFDLASIVDVGTIRVWNANDAGSGPGGPFTQEGIRDVEIFAGATVGTLVSQGMFQFAQGPGANGYLGQDFAVNFTGVQFVRFVVKTNWYGQGFNGAANWQAPSDPRRLVSLGEVRFETAVEAIPAPAALPAGLALMLAAAARRRRSHR